MENDKREITKEYKEQLKKELKELTTVKRKEVVEALKQARAHGDLSENAEYHACREMQGQLEQKIKEIEDILLNSVVVESSDKNIVGVGCVVKLKKAPSNEEVVFKIVSPEESNIAESKLSYQSPLGTLLIDKKTGDIVSVEAKSGKIDYKILSIE
ncbi:MAG: transcription elongation factor GreA [Candidatus Campbellbacteria bacterium]|nr:transcription elongation factor GreA [Candidatus Campbellbacteria bacterium]